MEYGRGPLSNPLTIAPILFRVSLEILQDCVNCYQECSALVVVSITNELCDRNGGTLGLQHGNNELDIFD
jgi:hypothetical protein